MRRKLFTLLAALAVLTVAAGGVSAAGIAEPVELLPADDDAGDISPAEEDSDSEELNPEDDSDEEADAGICVVGADSPCNGDDGDGSDGEQIGDDTAEEKRILIPEDQNGDGKIDERFRGNDSDEEAEVGVCVVGADSPCNGDEADGSDGEQIGDDTDEEKRILIPEDQNGDGKIDERFRDDDEQTTPATPGVDEEMVSTLTFSIPLLDVLHVF